MTVSAGEYSSWLLVAVYTKRMRTSYYDKEIQEAEKKKGRGVAVWVSA